MRRSADIIEFGGGAAGPPPYIDRPPDDDENELPELCDFEEDFDDDIAEPPYPDRRVENELEELLTSRRCTLDSDVVRSLLDAEWEKVEEDDDEDNGAECLECADATAVVLMVVSQHLEHIQMARASVLSASEMGGE